MVAEREAQPVPERVHRAEACVIRRRITGPAQRGKGEARVRRSLLGPKVGRSEGVVRLAFVGTEGQRRLGGPKGERADGKDPHPSPEPAAFEKWAQSSRRRPRKWQAP